MRIILRVYLSIVAAIGIAGAVHSADPVTFGLQDYRGRQHQMSEYADRPVMVLAFLGTECPLVKVYGLRLQQFADTYADRGVVVLGINSNRQDSVTEIAAFARQQQLSFPILKDLNNELADCVQAERTPEVVVLDAERKVRYRGRIDDQFGVGFSRTEITASELTDAVEAVLAGREVAVTYQPAEGCLIGRMRPTDSDSTVTYAGQVAGILNRHCVECHRAGEIAPFALTDYEQAAGWADMIREVTRDQRMPPWHAEPSAVHFANARGLTAEEKDLLNRWALAG
ncbi:MAG: redoxin domain-containing protein, partial [Planctomycetaceae bacterium]|nr:redoxin domain-containing protein [Planctomycetaceae bacterium]